MIKQNTPPTFAQLIDWLEGRLPAKESEQIANLITTADESTLADVAWLQKFYRASQNRVTGELPPDVSKRLEQRFATYAQTRQPPPFFQRLMATLSFDSHLNLVMGVRAAASSADQSRQLVYQTDLATIALTLQPRPQDKQIDLMGQLLPIQEIEPDLVRVVLMQDQVEFDSTLTDDFGEFTLTALPTGQYGLLLTGNQYEIEIFSFDLSL